MPEPVVAGAYLVREWQGPQQPGKEPAVHTNIDTSLVVSKFARLAERADRAKSEGLPQSVLQRHARHLLLLIWLLQGELLFYIYILYYAALHAHQARIHNVRRKVCVGDASCLFELCSNEFSSFNGC